MWEMAGIRTVRILAFDYYNSFVLHPMYIEPLEIMTNAGKNKVWNMPDCDYNRAVKRMQRLE